MSKTQRRGEDATGFWGTNSKNIFYHKEPLKSSVFVKLSSWTSLKDQELDLLITHSRAASVGRGEPKNNKNNHPFVSSNKQIALIHNGKVPDFEYEQLSKQYELSSYCDSELFLRVFEHGYYNGDIYNGVKNIWSCLNKSHMAVAIAQKNDTDKQLILFRNQHRPIWICDLRNALGQIFFFSTPDIWDSAVWEQYDDYAEVFEKTKLIEIPESEIWSFKLEEDVVVNKNIEKHKIALGNCQDFIPSDEIAIHKQDVVCTVVSGLDENEKVINPEIIEKPIKVFYDNCKSDVPSPYDEDYKMRDDLFRDADSKSIVELNNYCASIRTLVNDLETQTENALLEESISSSDYVDVISFLEQMESDLDAMIKRQGN